jgi:short-subunit dehydrogenase
LEYVNLKESEKTFNTNVIGLVRVTQQCIPLLRETAKEYKSAKICNISSIAGLIPLQGNGLYCSSKAAVQSLTTTLRNELVKFGIRVFNINPGVVKTEFRMSGRERFEKEMTTMDPKKKEVYPKYFDNFEKKLGYKDDEYITSNDIAKSVYENLLVKVPLENNVIGKETNLTSFFMILPKIIQNQLLRKLYEV